MEKIQFALNTPVDTVLGDKDNAIWERHMSCTRGKLSFNCTWVTHIHLCIYICVDIEYTEKLTVELLSVSGHGGKYSFSNYIDWSNDCNPVSLPWTPHLMLSPILPIEDCHVYTGLSAPEIPLPFTEKIQPLWLAPNWFFFSPTASPGFAVPLVLALCGDHIRWCYSW